MTGQLGANGFGKRKQEKSQQRIFKNLIISANSIPRNGYFPRNVEKIDLGPVFGTNQGQKPQESAKVSYLGLNFNFFPQILGEYACDGCGRCIQACTGKIDIRDVLKEAAG